MKLIAICFALFCCISHAAPSELDTRSLIHKEFNYLLEKRDFAALEKMYLPLLNGKARTPSGIWKLSVIDGAMRYYFYSSPDPAYWQQQEALAFAWKKAFPKSSAAALFSANIYLTQAWQARGSGFAHTVDEAQWPLVKQLANKARTELEILGEEGKRTPWWYNNMIYISLLANDGRRDELIMDGIQRHPNYYPIYFEALFSLTPKWGGSYEEIDEFIKASAANPKNGDGASLYARLYWYLDQVQTKGALFNKSKANWPTLKTAFNNLIKRYPDSWNLSAFANFACQAEDYEQADALFRALGTQLKLTSWTHENEATNNAYNACKAQIATLQMTPQEKEEDDLQAQKDIRRALEMLEKSKIQKF